MAQNGSNGHNGKTNGHALPHLVALARDPDDRAAFDAALEKLAADIAAPAPPAGIVACDLCGALTSHVLNDRGKPAGHYKVHYPQTAVRDAAGKVVPPCKRSWPSSKPKATLP